jgi:hypothetical protein
VVFPTPRSLPADVALGSEKQPEVSRPFKLLQIASSAIEQRHFRGTVVQDGEF